MSEKISELEFFWLGIAVILPTIVITAPNIVIQECGGAGWASIIAAGLSMGLLNHLFLTLGCNFSNKSIIGDSKEMFGPLLGKIILIPYILVLIMTNIMLLIFSTGYITFVMEESSITAFWIAISVLVAYLSSKGIEVIARSNTIGSFLLLTGTIIILLTTPLVTTLKLSRLKPLIFNFKRIIAGSLYPARLFFYHSVILIVLKPYFNNKKRVIKAVGFSNLVIQILVSVLVIFLVGIFGRNLASILNFSFHNLSDLSLSGVEVITFVIWILGNVLKMGIFNFVTVKLIADCFELKDYKRVVIPFTLLILTLTIYSSGISLPGLVTKYFVIGVLTTVSLPTILLLTLAYAIANRNKK
ncbi:GerAB/ArcD/ProY family transporter [Orenia marismortui]|uniref:GerAB/ArcD/ProY family transporter n=1 Tax=Orenia marismortui TaxID=46469 RepID=UPI00035DFE11|nr:GerAB/ArcD/ProY family transporter [Orenia marismortui]